MNFMSDTAAPVHPKVLEAIVQSNVGNAPSYGADDWTLSLKSALQRVFECDLDLWICGSGTAANALALSLLCGPTESILCHEMAHIIQDERGAPEFFTGGGRLEPLSGGHGQIDPEAFDRRVRLIDRSFVHETPPGAVSLTNLTEAGTVYDEDVFRHITSTTSAAGLLVHLDGARFANTVAFSGQSPANLSWRAGVDVLTLGGTKNGAMGCEVILLFGKARQKFDELKARAKRAGQMPPKMRFLAAQMLALLNEGLWLDLAAHANESAQQLAATLTDLGGTLIHPVQGNEVFVSLPEAEKTLLRSVGVQFYDWPDGGCRFVCSWNTEETDISSLAQLKS